MSDFVHVEYTGNDLWDELARERSRLQDAGNEINAQPSCCASQPQYLIYPRRIWEQMNGQHTADATPQ